MFQNTLPLPPLKVPFSFKPNATVNYHDSHKRNNERNELGLIFSLL